ncbi:hypothetical protein Fcan01_07716 [Folsomia candida]|uniref:Uncharacterized protein n=1 Tax=Folsomia candida TaxID=158441 RepID=A0A226EJB6_FOLCA|nr:hypothetical protein Fcan01_07716 [Folsomia candida]
MGCIHFYILLLIIISHIFRTMSYRAFRHKTEVEAFCSQKVHFIVNPSFTCCNMSVVEPGINLLEKWDTCTSEGSMQDDDVNNAYQAAWKVYSCIIQTRNGGESKITLSKFANLMSAKYPAEIQAKIMEQVASVEAPVSTDVSEFDQLNKLRRTYFDIELQVIIQTLPQPVILDVSVQVMDLNSSPDFAGITAITSEWQPLALSLRLWMINNLSDINVQDGGSCEPWEEEIHRGGRCCENSSFPFEIGLNSLMDTAPKTDLCLKQLQSTVFTKLSRNLSWAMENAIANIPNEILYPSILFDQCDLSCELMERSVLQPSELQDEDLFGIDFQQIASLLTPTWLLPTQVQDDSVAFAMQAFSLNDTIERIRSFEFADVKETKIFEDNGEESGVVLESTIQTIPDSLVHIPIICSAHNEILAYIELFLYSEKSCNDGS